MRTSAFAIAFAVLATLFGASKRAVGGDTILTQIFITVPEMTAPYTFTLYGSPRPPLLVVDFGSMLGSFTYSSDQLPSLTRELTNGRHDQLSFELNGNYITRPESFFGTSGLDAPRHFSALASFPNGIDWAGLPISSYDVQLRNPTTVIFTINGGISEPSSLVLAMAGGVLLFAGRRIVR
jgi:hypothetical protein